MQTNNLSPKIHESFSPINSTDRNASTQFTSSAKKIKRRHGPVKHMGLLVGFIVLAGIISILAFKILGDHSETSPSSQVKSVFSNDEMRDYNSPENKFIIKMPGFPSIDKSVIKDGEKDVPVSTYTRQIADGQQNYTLRIYDYNGLGLTLDENKALEAAINSALQNVPSIKVGDTKKGTFNGLNAIEASYTVNKDGKDYESHTRFVMKDNRIYSIILIGNDQQKFDEFANSLRLS